MNVNTPAAAPMAFFVPSHNAVYDRAELIPATLVQEKQNDGYRRPWVEITEARYIDQLETLPPEGVWRGVVQIDGVYGRGCDRDFCPVWRAFL